jgi:hypothetical protein
MANQNAISLLNPDIRFRAWSHQLLAVNVKSKSSRG